MLVGADSPTGNPPAMPGYTLPGEHTDPGHDLPAGHPAHAKVPGAGDSFAGNFMIALGDEGRRPAARLTNFGLMLDGIET